ncbi:MAG: lysozyme [Alphaproteobacteria bacterium]|nr:lysozyme [Alphaproteobacteria bacterium]
MRFENFSPIIYADITGNPTIGYGHLVTAGENYYGALNQDDALGLLVSDIESKANIMPYLGVSLEENQLDALTSLCFNIGIGNFMRSTLLQKINMEDTYGSYEYFGHWRNANGVVSTGLIKRRFAELFVFANQELDPSDDTAPSMQWGLDPMPITDENWRRIGYDLRNEAVAIYQDYVS